jgi:hypothetical protein
MGHSEGKSMVYLEAAACWRSRVPARRACKTVPSVVSRCRNRCREESGECLRRT